MTNAQLPNFLPELENSELSRAMRYAVTNGGKRIRPLLVYNTGLTLGASLEQLDRPAAAIEFIHCYSLVHDDLPAMDDDDLRRGQPSCHKAFDEATAILVGDALQSLAFELIATNADMVLTLARAAGANGMVGGQSLDLQAEGQALTLEQLEQLHSLKTGALIHASVRLGALAAGCNDHHTLQVLERFALQLGLAFQVQDDILDVEGNTEELGKFSGADARLNKATYPSLMGLDAAKHKLQELYTDALQALNELRVDASALRDLTQSLMHRMN